MTELNGPLCNPTTTSACGDSATIGPFSQTLFLGASIVSFNTKLGFNGDESTLNVTLVEDPCDNEKCYYDGCLGVHTTTEPDFFNPPILGSAVHFQYGIFEFNGILKSWKQDNSSGGKTYSITVADPSQIVAGTQLILQNFTGPVTGINGFKLPNIVNIIGYIEERAGTCLLDPFASPFNSFSPSLGYDPANGYGNSNSNEGGLSWSQPSNFNGVFAIRQALEDLTNLISFDAATQAQQNAYGGTLKMRGHTYFLDLTDMPELTPDFRITGDSISLMDLISQVCHAAGYDFYFSLVFSNILSCSPNSSNTAGLITDVAKHIKIRTIRRLENPIPASNVDGFVGTPIETRLDQGTIGEFVSNPSHPTSSSNRGVELRQEETNAFLVGDFRQDIFDIQHSGSGNGLTDTISHYWGLDENNFIIVGEGEGEDHSFTVDSSDWGVVGLDDTYTINTVELNAATNGFSNWAAYMAVDKGEIYDAIELDGIVSNAEALAAANAIVGGKGIRAEHLQDKKIVAATKASLQRQEINQIKANHANKLMYQTIKKFADLYGKKFYVKADGLCVALSNSNTENFALRTNWSPSDAAWSDASSVGGLGQFSDALNFFRLEDGRIKCFVKFDTSNEIDVTTLSPDSYFSTDVTQVFVATTVEKMAFLSDGSPRVLISLDSAVRSRDVSSRVVPDVAKLLKDIIEDADAAKNLTGRFGGSSTLYGISASALIPTQIAMPLLSKDISYGPWASTDNIIGPNSKSRYERDTTFNPWNFGSTSSMNAAGTLSVRDRATLQISSEFGSLSVAGSPTLNRLGLKLLNNGPEITSIDVNVGTNGVTTNYNMRTYTPSYGEKSKRTVDESLRLISEQQASQQKLLNKQGEKLSEVNTRAQEWQREMIRGDRDLRQTPHNFISAENIPDYSDVTNLKTVSVSHNIKETLPELRADDDSEYIKKASVEMAGIFRPFSTVSHSSLPSFEDISLSAEGITVNDLNPFRSGHDIEYVTRGTTYPTDLGITPGGYDTDGIYRSISLRGPVIISGWGYDLDDKPVPNATPGSPSSSFAEGFLKRSNTWKCGPLDVRWDGDRGVWTSIPASGTTNISAFESIDLDKPSLTAPYDFNSLNVGQGIIVGRDSSDPEKELTIWSDMKIREETSPGVCKVTSTNTTEFANFDKLIVSNGLVLSYAEPFTATIALNFQITDLTSCSSDDPIVNEPFNTDHLKIGHGLQALQEGCVTTINSIFSVTGWEADTINPIPAPTSISASLPSILCGALEEGPNLTVLPANLIDFGKEFEVQKTTVDPCKASITLRDKPSSLIKFKALEDFTTFSSDVDVESIRSFNGIDPSSLLEVDGDDGKKKFRIINPEVENTEGLHMFEGDIKGYGFAEYDEETCEYVIIQMECKVSPGETSASDDVLQRAMSLAPFS